MINYASWNIWHRVCLILMSWIAIKSAFRARRASPASGIIAQSHVDDCKTSNAKIWAGQGGLEGRAPCNLNAGESLKRHLKGPSGGCFDVKHSTLKGAFISSISAVPLPTESELHKHIHLLLVQSPRAKWGNPGKFERHFPPTSCLTSPPCTPLCSRMCNPYYLIGCVHLGTDCIHSCPLLQTPGFLLLCSVGLPLGTAT